MRVYRIWGETMQKNLRLTILVMALFSVLLFLLIIGPEINDAAAASNNSGGSFTAADDTDAAAGDTDPSSAPGDSGVSAAAVNDRADSPESRVVDSSDEPTGPTAENDPSDVTCEITEPEVAFELKYDKYLLTYTYILVHDGAVNIRKGPSAAEEVLRTASENEKLNYIETVTAADGGKWYHVTWQEKDRRLFGFVNTESVAKRVFQFDKMHEAVLKAERAADRGPLTYISNYHNLKGYAPPYQGGDVDKAGGRRSQAAPGYPNPADLSEFSYLTDGTLVRVVSSGAQYTKVALVKNETVYFVPNKYVATPAAVTEAKKAVVIDRANQNEVVFEKIGPEWKVVSYTLATTGTTGTYHQPTPLGFYFGIEKRERFYYYEDGTTKIQGYAPYAVRFSGGAYVHGVPVNYKFDENGGRIDPGKAEYSWTLGTVPLSHKCVRNYTSHAKFIYDWYTPGEVIVIVIE